MTTTTPTLGLILYDSTTDQAVLFATWRAIWGGTATTSNFYKIDTSIGGIQTRLSALAGSKGSVPVLASFISANYYEATTVDISAYTYNMTILLSLNTDSNGTVTLNINGLGTKSVMKVNNSGAIVNITGAELQSGKYYLFVYDGTRFLWVNANSGDQIYMAGTSGNVVTVNSDNTLIQETPYNVTESGINSSITSSSIIDNTKKFLSLTASNVLEKINYGTFFSSVKSTLLSNVVSTYSLIYTTGNGFIGGVLAQNGDIHFVPFEGRVGQKISNTGVVSTYSLVYTVSQAYAGGVLAPNGDIHFIRTAANRGQKVSSAGVVSTYSLVYTAGSYWGGVIAPNGDIHFVPLTANRGQKVANDGIVSTYSLAYTSASGAHRGGVLALNGDIHFVPNASPVGQKISSAGVVSTYSLVYTASGAYVDGVLALNGDIHFIPSNANRGQKVSSAGVVSTYSLVYTTGGAYEGGVLAPNGDIHMIPSYARVGQKISSAGVVSTYSLVYTTNQAYQGGVLSLNGEIYLVAVSATVGQKITLYDQSDIFPPALLQSGYLNKL